jgi:hypothetical protein
MIAFRPDGDSGSAGGHRGHELGPSSEASQRRARRSGAHGKRLLGATKMSYRELKPHPALCPFVDRFWVRTNDGRSDTSPMHILPDGCIDLMVDVASGGNAAVVGAMTRATLAKTCRTKKPSPEPPSIAFVCGGFLLRFLHRRAAASRHSIFCGPHVLFFLRQC